MCPALIPLLAAVVALLELWAILDRSAQAAQLDSRGEHSVGQGWRRLRQRFQPDALKGPPQTLLVGTAFERSKAGRTQPDGPGGKGREDEVAAITQRIEQLEADRDRAESERDEFRDYVLDQFRTQLFHDRERNRAWLFAVVQIQWRDWVALALTLFIAVLGTICALA